MDARHTLNLTVQRITGTDIRHLGNWDSVPCVDTYRLELAAALQVRERELGRCRDIADLLDLIAAVERARPAESGQNTLF